MQHITITTAKGGYFVQHSNDEGGSGATVACDAKELVQAIGDALGWDPVKSVEFGAPLADPKACTCRSVSEPTTGCKGDIHSDNRKTDAPCVVLEAIGAPQPLLVARVGDSIANVDGRLHRVKEIRNG